MLANQGQHYQENYIHTDVIVPGGEVQGEMMVVSDERIQNDHLVDQNQIEMIESYPEKNYQQQS